MSAAAGEYKTQSGKRCWKVPYFTQGAAIAASAALKARRDNFHAEKRVYHCRQCDLWHLTTEDKRA